MGMTSECIDVERIADVLELSEQDPLRHHVDQCPRSVSQSHLRLASRSDNTAA